MVGKETDLDWQTSVVLGGARRDIELVQIGSRAADIVPHVGHHIKFLVDRAELRKPMRCLGGIGYHVLIMDKDGVLGKPLQVNVH